MADRVEDLSGLPQSSVGAPLPIVIADEKDTYVAYLVENTPEGWDGSTVRTLDYGSDESVAIVHFRSAHATKFGPPNDEAFAGHPLAAKGLRPYGAFRIYESSWIRELERMNAVHPYHQPERFDALQHVILTFHDSTFEVVAEDFSVETVSGPLRGAVETISQRVVS